jgi:uncharacterized protein (DUF488 family)
MKKPCKGERVPLKVRNLGAGKEDVLTSSGGCLLLFDLKLHDIGWMLDDLRHICPVTGAYFAEDTLRNPNDASNEPIALWGVTEKLSKGRRVKLTQKTPMVSEEQ